MYVMESNRVVMWFLIIVRDNLGDVKVIVDILNGIELLFGLYDIYYEVVDGLGNSEVCFFLINVIMF